MAANPNTMTLKSVWFEEYQITHYKQPVYPIFADEKLAPKLKKGNTIYRTYKSGGVVSDMGGDGSYAPQAIVDSQESLVINKEKEYSFYLKELDLEQAHLDVKRDYARKAMNEIFLQIDSDVLAAMTAGAGSVIDNSILVSGGTGAISATAANVAAIFSLAQQALQLKNVIYSPNKEFAGTVRLEKTSDMAVAAISPNLYQAVIMFLGGKTSKLGDDVARNGYAMWFMGFNIFVSNNLTWTATLTLGANPTNGDVFSFGSINFKWVTSASGTTKAGTVGAPAEIQIGASASASADNFVTALVTTPFAATTSVASGLTKTADLAKILSNITAVNTTGTVAITAAGKGSLLTTATWTSGSNSFNTLVQHNIFGVSKSIDLVIQKTPDLFINPVSGKVGKDYVTWTAYGSKVFKDQSTQIVDIQIDTTNFGALQPVQTNN